MHMNPKDLLIESWPEAPRSGMRLGMPKGIKATHVPTGLVATSIVERSQHGNRVKALELLSEQLAHHDRWIKTQPPQIGASVTLKTADLIGDPLDWAVSAAELTQQDRAGDYVVPYLRERLLSGGVPFASYSTIWSWAGPLIERESIQLTPCEDMASWSAGLMFRQGVDDYVGPSPLIAAMRCYVASVFGKDVEIPDTCLRLALAADS